MRWNTLSDSFAVADYEKKRETEQTQRGLVLLIIGALVTSIPIVRPAGSFVTLAAIIFLIEGRDQFGRKHSVQIAVGTIVFAIAASFLIVASIGYLLFLYVMSNLYGIYYPGDSVVPLATIQLLPSFLLIDAIGTILTTLSYTILTTRLTNTRERVLLGVGLALGVVTSVVSFSSLDSAYSNELAFWWGPVSWNIDVARNYQGELLAWSSLSLVSAIIFAVVFYSAYSRMDMRKGN